MPDKIDSRGGNRGNSKQRRGGPAENERQIKNNSSDTAEKYQFIKNITGLNP